MKISVSVNVFLWNFAMQIKKCMFLFTSEESYKSHYLFILKKLDFETFTGYKVTQKKICFYAYSVASETFAKDFFFTQPLL